MHGGMTERKIAKYGRVPDVTRTAGTVAMHVQPPARHPIVQRFARFPDFRVSLLAAPSHSYRVVALCGVRQRLQLRGSAGFPPASHQQSELAHIVTGNEARKQEILQEIW